MFAMYIYNRIFIQIYASAVWVEHLALHLSASLIFSALARQFLPHSGVSRSRARSSLAVFLAMVSELSARYDSEYTCSLQAVKRL